MGGTAKARDDTRYDRSYSSSSITRDRRGYILFRLTVWDQTVSCVPIKPLLAQPRGLSRTGTFCKGHFEIIRRADCISLFLYLGLMLLFLTKLISVT